MSIEADSVAILIGEDPVFGDSSLPEEAERVATSEEGTLLGNLPRSQQQEITVDHGLHISIGELLKVIEGANGMPVLFVPSSESRLAAVAVHGLQNLVPANRDNEESAEKKQLAFRSWLLFLASLVATVTFTAGLTPPGGFWNVDDKANGYIAGTSVMHDKFQSRYLIFYYSNTTAFLASLMVIGMLAKHKVTVLNNIVFRTLVVFCLLSLGGSYIAGTSANSDQWAFSTVIFVLVIAYFSLPWFLDWIALFIQKGNKSPESIA